MGMISLCSGEIWRGPTKNKGKPFGRIHIFQKFRHAEKETNVLIKIGAADLLRRQSVGRKHIYNKLSSKSVIRAMRAIFTRDST